LRLCVGLLANDRVGLWRVVVVKRVSTGLLVNNVLQGLATFNQLTVEQLELVSLLGELNDLLLQAKQVILLTCANLIDLFAADKAGESRAFDLMKSVVVHFLMQSELVVHLLLQLGVLRRKQVAHSLTVEARQVTGAVQ